MRHFLRQLNRAWRQGRTAPVILMYHRVAEPLFDPWGLAIKPHAFDAQMDILARTREPLAMDEFVRRLDSGKLSPHAVAVTFDDGYVDNLQQAAPLLMRHAIPATLFLATGSTGQKVEYWWDELTRLVLGNRDGVDASILIGPETQPLQLEALETEPVHDQRWRAWEPATNSRQALYVALWEKLRLLSQPDREAAMQRLREVLQASPPQTADLPMTQAELQQLIKTSTFSLGGHGTHHPVLPSLTEGEQRADIANGKHACEQLTGQPVSGFAYPYGARDAQTAALVREAGFNWACTTVSAAVSIGRYGRVPRFDRFALPRMAATDSAGPAFQAVLRGAGPDQA